MDYFHPLKAVASQHIPHKYSDEMKFKSEIVSSLTLSNTHTIFIIQEHLLTSAMFLGMNTVRCHWVY